MQAKFAAGAALLLSTANALADVSLSNGNFTARWTTSGGALKPDGIADRAYGANLAMGPADFTIKLADGTEIASSAMKLTAEPKQEKIVGKPGASKLSDRLAGTRISALLTDAGHGLAVNWSAVLLNGSHYLREEIAISAEGGDIAIAQVRMIDLDATGFQVVGTVQGSPLASASAFASVEHPMAQSVVESGRARSSISRKLPLKEGQSWAVSSVTGFAPAGQLRRAFLEYVERERAHPYRTFLHYNSWYDIGYFTPYNETECLDVIAQYSKELVQKRGVKMSSFLFDDGWDDKSGDWNFHKGFPNGFSPIKAAAERIGADPGIWLSPWGGYGDPRDQRLAGGKKLGYEIDSEGFALSGPKYYKRFHEVCLDLVGKYGINQFKLDGTGSPDKQVPGSAFGSDFEAAIQLIQDLRGAKPGLFINLTTGTWPSPFWTRYADSIWRGGEDHSFAGVGSWRQRWITYKDSDTYTGVVKAGPLYPINSLMLHGIIYAKHANHLNTDPHGDFRDEIHDYFGTGTQLQEMYVTPANLTAQNWDDLAEAANWSRANADILRDVHWIGGDPAKLEVYGWAAWNSRGAILTLRNPSDKPQSISIDPATAFELPSGAAREYRMHSPWKSDAATPWLTFMGGKSQTISLRPYQVLNLQSSK